jgi:hypothetical protein
MTVVLLLHPKINCMTIHLVMQIQIFRSISPCGNFSNHISRTFLNHSSYWIKSKMSCKSSDFFIARAKLPDCRRQVYNDYSPCGNFSNHISRTFRNHSSHWFKLNDVYIIIEWSHHPLNSNRGQMSISIQKRMN